MTRMSKFNVRKSTTVKNDHLISDMAWYKNAKTFAKDSEKEVKRTKEKWSKGY